MRTALRHAMALVAAGVVVCGTITAGGARFNSVAQGAALYPLDQPIMPPATVTIAPYASVRFVSPAARPAPQPPDMLVVASSSDQPVSIAYDGTTLTVTAPGGYAVLVTAGDPANCTSEISPQQVVVCSPVSMLGPPTGNGAGFTTIPTDHMVFAAYASEWNLIAGPDGTELPAGTSALFSYDAQSDTYQGVDAQSSSLRGATGYWAYTAMATTAALPAISGGTMQLKLDVGRYALIGDPYPVAAYISGNALVYTYDAATGAYQPVEPQDGGPLRAPLRRLEPGQGAWIYPLSDGVSIGPEVP